MLSSPLKKKMVLLMRPLNFLLKASYFTSFSLFFKDILKYLDSPEMCQIPKEDEKTQRPSRPCIEDFSSNIQQSSEPPIQIPLGIPTFLPMEGVHSQNQEPPTPPPPPGHQDLIETQNELQKLTQTMTAFHPIPPPRQVLHDLKDFE